MDTIAMYQNYLLWLQALMVAANENSSAMRRRLALHRVARVVCLQQPKISTSE